MRLFLVLVLLFATLASSSQAAGVIRRKVSTSDSLGEGPDPGASSSPASSTSPTQPTLASLAPALSPPSGTTTVLDSMFLTPTTNVAPLELDSQLARASSLVNTFTEQIAQEQTFARHVYEVIQDYQFKYSKLLEDVDIKKDKLTRLSGLLKRLKQAKAHQLVEKSLGTAAEQLSILGEDPQVSPEYKKLLEAIGGAKSDIASLSAQSVSQALRGTEEQIVETVLSNPLPPLNDALSSLPGWSSSKE